MTNVQVKIDENTFCISGGDMFFVKQGQKYTIINDNDSIALLYYVKCPEPDKPL